MNCTFTSRYIKQWCCHSPRLISYRWNILRTLSSTTTIPTDGEVVQSINRKLSKQEYKKLSKEEKHERALARVRTRLNSKKKKRATEFSLLCIDMSEDRVHTNHDRSSLCTQLLFGYTFMKKSPTPFHLHITSLSDLHTAEIKNALLHRGYNNWYADIHSETPWQFFCPSKPHKNAPAKANNSDISSIVSDVCSKKEDSVCPVSNESSEITSDVVDYTGRGSYSRSQLVILSPDATDALTSFDRDHVCTIILLSLYSILLYYPILYYYLILYTTSYYRCMSFQESSIAQSILTYH